MEEIVKQKHEILENMAAETGIPSDVLISKMYRKEANKQAKYQVKEILQDSGDEGTKVNDTATNDQTASNQK